MSVVQTLYASRPETKREALPEHSLVELLASAKGLEGGTIPAGSVGTIVGILADGRAYDVEFEEPCDDVATVEAAGLKAAASLRG